MLIHTEMEILIIEVSELLLVIDDSKITLGSKHMMVKNKDVGEKGTFVSLTTTEDAFGCSDCANVEATLKEAKTKTGATAFKLGDSA